MSTIASELDKLTLTIAQELVVRSSLEATFAAILEQMGPGNENHEGQPLPMTLEPWPGGRWFRDLGEGNGHYWGTVQAIRRPTLLEICGPLMMSAPVTSNIQYRLTPIDGGTKVTFRHTALGLIPEGAGPNFSLGWTRLLEGITRRASRS